MSGTSRIDWRVPAEEWERFITFVDEERVANDRYIRQYVELAMEEWVDSDGGAALEERVDRVIRAAGRTPDAHTEKKDTSSAGLSSDALANQEKVRVTRKVFAEVHAKFDAYVEEHSDNNAGVELGRALRQYRQANRLDRIEEKLDRVVDDAEALLSELDDSGEGTGMGAVKKRTIKICRRLPDGQFLREELREAIRAEGLESEPTVEQYENRVCDRLGYVPHPNNYDLLMPESDLPEYGVDPDAPAIDRLPYEALDRSERLDGIAIELARAAAARSGTAAMTVKQVHREIFDGNGSANYMRQLMDDVADRPGYEWRTPRGDRSKRLKVVLSKVDEEILETLRRDRDRDRDQSTDGGATSPAVADGGWPPS